MSGYNFTDRLRRVMSLARLESLRLRHEYLGPEHLLLALCRESEGVAAAVLANLSAGRPVLIARVEEIAKVGRYPLPDDAPVPFTSRAKRVLELAMSAARDMSHDYVGTEHLLLGLVHEGKGIAAQVLLANGVTLDGARAETRRLLGLPPAPDLPPSIGDLLSVPRRPPPIAIVIELPDVDGGARRRTFDSARAAIRFLESLRIARGE